MNNLKSVQELVNTLCLLEMYFLPEFFDIMVHVTMHLVREVQLYGPICFQRMYLFEQYMKVLKSYVRKGNNTEGCMVDCFVSNEAPYFCIKYIENQ